MSEVIGGSRRRFLQASLGLLGAACVGSRAAAFAKSSTVVEWAKAGLDRVGDRIPNQDLVAVADFRSASSHKRLHLVDIANGRVDSLLVAHGRGSDPNHTGWPQRFSNDMEADCTSSGAYLTGED